ncbi:MAG: hypothetical protein R3C14_51720 [Caldilineaceae bacterium]
MLKETFVMQQDLIWSASLVDALVAAFNRAEIVYSHWKSNIDLAQATAGEIDLDFLVDRRSLPQALTILAQLGFKAADARWGTHPPSICHYYGLDPESKQLIHVHLFTRVLTGESFVKSHLLPFEAMLLENVYPVNQMRVTAKPAELVLFTVRMFIKYGSLLDLLIVARKAKQIKKEALWLQAENSLPEAFALLRHYCPVIDEKLFLACVETISQNTSLWRRIRLARKVRQRLSVYTKHSPSGRALAYLDLCWSEVQRRLGPKRKNRVLQGGGAVIAFVGADATGKSTLVAETGRWLGEVFTVAVIHTGKPPSSWVTAPINLLLTLVRRRLPAQGSRDKEQHNAETVPGAQHHFRGLASLPYALRSVALAWDRRRLIARTRRQAAKGELIICDRYPSRTLGAMDSPRLEPATHQRGTLVKLYNYLARLESALYRQIPPPDIVLRLHVSLETAKKRNRARNGQDDESYLEARHRQSREWQMVGTRYEYVINTEQTLEATIDSVKEAIWSSL